MLHGSRVADPGVRTVIKKFFMTTRGSGSTDPKKKFSMMTRGSGSADPGVRTVIGFYDDARIREYGSRRQNRYWFL
jgi:hypothetical protein